MARSIDDIRNGLIASFVSIGANLGISITPDNWSNTDYKQMTLDTVAGAQGYEEQLWDAYQAVIQSYAAVLPPQTYAWFQFWMINVFQYNATDVQLIQILAENNFVPKYPLIKVAYQIIKYCSVTQGGLGVTLIKCAKQSGNLPAQLSSDEIDAAQTFVNMIGIGGINYVIKSQPSDRLFLQLDVYYNGLYSSVIQASVVAALVTFLASIPFDGVVRLSYLEQAVLAVPGVIDLVIINAQARANATTFGSGTDLILNRTEVANLWGTDAGYCVLEDTTGYTLIDPRVSDPTKNNLNLIAQ